MRGLSRARARWAALAALGLSAGCQALPQSEACATYVECQAHYDEVQDRPPSETAPYEADGSCWEHEDIAADCTEVCAELTEERRAALTSRGLSVGPC